ncbi:MAG: hypothetical protein ACR2PK_14150 [Acidimicrobiales bacterium]
MLIDPPPDPEADSSTRTSRMVTVLALAAVGLGVVLSAAWMTSTTRPDEPPPESTEPAPTTPPTARPAPGTRLVRSDGNPGALAAPLRLLHGSSPSYQLQLDPDGAVSVAIEPPNTRALEVPDGTILDGFPVASVAGGVLVIPSDKALGAVTFWTAANGIELPLPKAPNSTSYLTAGDESAVLLSDGDLVVLNMATRTETLRTEARLDGVQVVNACLSPDETHIAMVAGDGRGIIVRFADATTVHDFETSTPLGGVAWTSPRQFVNLDERQRGRVFLATDVDSASTEVIATAGDDGPWHLLSNGSGC